jgi:hypothetical protein
MGSIRLQLGVNLGRQGKVLDTVKRHSRASSYSRRV